MKMKLTLAISALALGALVAKQTPPGISGDYLEVRSCDVYTGSCVGNSEMNLSGREGILVWSVREGNWKGTVLNGMSVIAVIRADDTLGDQRHQPRQGTAVLILDDRASTDQRAALTDLARTMSGSLVHKIADIKTSRIESNIATCTKRGCASIKAGDLVEISTRCFGDKDHLCGNEDTFYPPLTVVAGAYPAYTEVAAYRGTGLDVTFESTEKRSAFLGAFNR
jgi:hypothetical protein